MSLAGDIIGMWRNRDRIRDIVGINRRNVELVYGHNRRRDYPLVDDKIVCKELLAANRVPVAPTLYTVQGLFAIGDAISSVRDRGHFVVKPATGSGGDGILVLGDRVDGGWLASGGRIVTEDALRSHLASTVFGAYSKLLDDRALIEERVVQHPDLQAIFPDGVSDIRLIVLRGVCLMAMIRVPTARSGGRANLHQGGIGIAIDLDSGMMTRAVSKGVELERHPDSGAQLVGSVLPHWRETIEVGRRAAACVPLGYLGVDIVLDASLGPLVLELNARPGLEIQNVNGRPLGPIAQAVGA